MSARPGLRRLGLHQRRRDAVGLAGRACFHVLSVVEWLTRWTVENSSCKPVTCSVGGGLFLLPTVPAERPKWHAWWIREAQKTLRSCVLFSFRRLATASAVCRGACCGIILA